LEDEVRRMQGRVKSRTTKASDQGD
jgi:hypothetical protein